MNAQLDNDRRWMAAALRLARRGAGRCWPNPAVGAILVQGEGERARVVGRAVTAPGGRPHAETLALQEAGVEARGATCYVTLEPCSHYARTPPCVNALREAGVARVVSAVSDPDPRVAGRGYAILREAGISVDTEVLAEEAEWHHRGHFTRITRGRPHSLLKMAISADGAIGCRRLGQVQITGPEVRSEVHLVRAETDAIMVGFGTVQIDNPMLTCRIEGLEDRSPVRVILDTRAETPLSSFVAKTAEVTPTWLLVAEDADPERIAALSALGVKCFRVSREPGGRLCLHTALSVLGEQGVTTVLIEGGARLAESLVRSDLVDLVDFYHAKKVIGEDRIPALNGLPLNAVTESERYRQVDDRMVGTDLFRQYKRVA